jgi:transposase
MSMSKSRRKYSAEFKHDAVRLSQDPAHTVAEVAANLGIDLGVLQRWKAQSKANGSKAFPGHGRPKAGDEEVLRLRKELARVQQERGILKKAVASRTALRRCSRVMSRFRRGWRERRIRCSLYLGLRAARRQQRLVSQPSRLFERPRPGPATENRPPGRPPVPSPEFPIHTEPSATSSAGPQRAAASRRK